MASPNPVPSRAAINALRGVILTTSCSVILLAEERRRRIQIARAAIDNARKLHTVRVHHGPALSEALSRRESWPVELGEDLPPMSISPQSNGPLRRKRRNEQSRAVAKAIEPKASSTQTSQTRADDRITRQKEWNEWDEARREISRISVSPFAHHDLFLRISTDEETPIPPLTPQELKPKGRNPRHGELMVQTKPRDAETPEEIRPSEPNPPATLGAIEPPLLKQETQNVLRSAFRLEETAPNSPAPAVKAVSPPTPLLRVEKVSTPQASSTTILPSKSLLVEAKDENALTGDSASPLQAITNEAAASGEKPRLEESYTSIDEMLAKLSSPSANQDGLSEQLDSAIKLFQELVSAQALTSGAAIPRGYSLLRAAVELQKYDKIPAILDITLPACTNVLQLISPFMDLLQLKGDAEAVRQLLTHNSAEAQNTLDSSGKVRRLWVADLLRHRWWTLKDSTTIKNLYQLLQDGGLFTHARLPMTIQYNIRRRIALIALDAGDDALLATEMEQLRNMRPEALKSDLKLNGKLIIRNARAGQWNSMHKDLASLKGILGPDNLYYQKVLAKITDIYAKKHSQEEVDVFVRELVDVYKMTLNQTLAFLVMDRHGRNRDITALAHWLQFCQEEGLEMNQAFFDKVADKCCKYWNFVRIDVQNLFNGLRTFIPWLGEPQLENYTQNGGLSTLHKQRPQPETAQEGAKLPILPMSMGVSRGEFERNAFNCMNSRALQDNWDQVSEVYKEASTKGLKFSSRCLRLAVIANINKEGGCSKSASDLVLEAHESGHDVSSALVPLLFAQLEAGRNPETLINDTLHQGLRIHDSVYNKAARMLAKNGRDDASIKMCKLAAQENGDGDLAYNEYNFSNLLLEYAKLSWYADLRSLVSSYVSKTLYWHGSNECKQSIKFAMKRVALKAETNPSERHFHEDALLCIEQAHQHVKECRSTIKGDRQVLKKQIMGAFKSFQPPDVFEHGVSPEISRIPAPESKAAPQMKEAVPVLVEEKWSAGRGRRPRSRSNSRTKNKMTRPNREASVGEQIQMGRVVQGRLNMAATF